MQTSKNRRSFLGSSLAAGSLAMVARPARAAVPRIKVGQIGTGHAHATKLSVYRDSDDYEVVGVVEPNPELRQRASKLPAFQGVRWLTQPQLLETAGLQAVLVETDVSDLLNTAEACIAAGKHVHLDKPAGESLAQYRRLLAAAADQQLLVQMGYMYRYNPAVELLGEFVQQGWLGEIFEIHAVMSKVVDEAARHDLTRFQGGMMFELGCHLIDLVHGVLGAPSQVRAFSRHSAAIDDGLQDNMLAVLEYPNALATVKTTALEVEGFARRHFVVCGTEGTFHIQPLDNPAARIALSKARDGYIKGYQDIAFPKYARYVADAADMAQVIRGSKPADFSYQHDLEVQTSVLKACRMD